MQNIRCSTEYKHNVLLGNTEFLIQYVLHGEGEPFNNNIFYKALLEIQEALPLIREYAKNNNLLNTQEWINFEDILNVYSNKDPND